MARRGSRTTDERPTAAVPNEALIAMVPWTTNEEKMPKYPLDDAGTMGVVVAELPLSDKATDYELEAKLANSCRHLMSCNTIALEYKLSRRTVTRKRRLMAANLVLLLIHGPTRFAVGLVQLSTYVCLVSKKFRNCTRYVTLVVVRKCCVTDFAGLAHSHKHVFTKSIVVKKDESIAKKSAMRTIKTGVKGAASRSKIMGGKKSKKRTSGVQTSTVLSSTQTGT